MFSEIDESTTVCVVGVGDKVLVCKSYNPKQLLGTVVQIEASLPFPVRIILKDRSYIVCDYQNIIKAYGYYKK